MKFTVTLKFNAVKNRWDMSVGKHFVMDFPPCKNFSRFFDEPSRTRKETYTIDIKRKGKSMAGKKGSRTWKPKSKKRTV